MISRATFRGRLLAGLLLISLSVSAVAAVLLFLAFEENEREEAQAWIDRQTARYTRDGYGYWIALDPTGEPIGQIGLMQVDDPRLDAPAIGYIVRRAMWRQGYAAEGASACRDHAFKVLDADEVISLIRPENTPSMGVARRIGLEPAERLEYAGYEHIVFRARRPHRD